MNQIGRGTLLIASPEIDTGIYFRSVILLCDHGVEGSLGIILNKRSDMGIVKQTCDTQEKELNPKLQTCIGGPLQPSHMMVLHSSKEHSVHTLQICEGVYLGGDLHFLQEVIYDPRGPAARVCFGYCGWRPGQLEQEVMSSIWFLHPASSGYVFQLELETLWKDLLRDMGDPYAALAKIPDDLSLN